MVIVRGRQGHGMLKKFSLGPVFVPRRIPFLVCACRRSCWRAYGYYKQAIGFVLDLRDAVGEAFLRTSLLVNLGESSAQTRIGMTAVIHECRCVAPRTNNSCRLDEAIPNVSVFKLLYELLAPHIPLDLCAQRPHITKDRLRAQAIPDGCFPGDAAIDVFKGAVLEDLTNNPSKLVERVLQCGRQCFRPRFVNGAEIRLSGRIEIVGVVFIDGREEIRSVRRMVSSDRLKGALRSPSVASLVVPVRNSSAGPIDDRRKQARCAFILKAHLVSASISDFDELALSPTESLCIAETIAHFDPVPPRIEPVKRVRSFPQLESSAGDRVQCDVVSLRRNKVAGARRIVFE